MCVKPAFGPDGLKLLHGPAWGINLLQLAGWVGRTYCPSGLVHAREAMEPVREALQTLDSAGRVRYRWPEAGVASERPSRRAHERVGQRMCTTRAAWTAIRSR
jgi:hypothetical protein